jgi:hypothetical protein
MDRATLTAFSEICARCDGQMVAKPDAVGRVRLRCPRCDGVSAPQVRHPDDAMLPQGLVKVHQLPPVAPDQLRCQRCAHGVIGEARFCVACVPPKQYQPKVCRCVECGRTFTPTGPRAEFCEACR